uniref:Uncharacterized protein n=1 Tax=Bactrocera dorsalis TaxID=27457 RepID=A0A034W5H3_BACDO
MWCNVVQLRDDCFNNKNIEYNTYLNSPKFSPKSPSEDLNKYPKRKINKQSNEGIMLVYPLRDQQILGKKDYEREDMYCNHQSANAILPCYLTKRTSLATSIRPIFIAEKNRFYMSCCEIL